MTRTSLAGKVELHRGQSYKSALLDEPGPYLLGLGTIARNGGFSGGSLRTYGGESPERILLRPGDLYLSLKDVTHKAELLGAVARVPEHIELGRLTQDTVRLQITSDQVHADYLYWLLQTPDYRAYCRLRGTGTTNLDLSRADFLGYEFRLPSVGEQQAIAEVLGALDDKIAANTALASTVDRYLATLLDEMASGADGTTLESIADVNRRAVKPVTDGHLRYVDIASVAVGSFDYPNISAWSEAPGRARRAVSAGDTMWSTVRPNRRSHALNLEDDPLLVASTGLAILSPREVGFAYLYEATRRPEFTAYLENVAEGSAYPAVRADRFLDAPVPDLSVEQTRVFEGQAAPLRELVASQARENRTLAATRDVLLPQLMSGKLRVRDAERIAEDAGA